MDLKGPIRMKNPEVVFTVLENYVLRRGEKHPDSTPSDVWLTRLIGETQRSVADKYDLKKRRYIGTTSFDAELALLTCNIAQVRPGTLVYDPFAGTGSFLVAAGHFGALTVGSDIDVRMIKGKGPQRNIPANFQQYGISDKFLDVLTMDFTHNGFRNDLKLDAIICDPPYGVREGLKILGSKDPARFEGKENVLIDGIPAHLRKDYIPPKKPFELNALLDLLLQFAADRLSPSGRLCFWMPTSNEDFEPNSIPHHSDLILVAECVQEFNKCKQMEEHGSSR